MSWLGSATAASREGGGSVSLVLPAMFGSCQLCWSVLIATRFPCSESKDVCGKDLAGRKRQKQSLVSNVASREGSGKARDDWRCGRSRASVPPLFLLLLSMAQNVRRQTVRVGSSVVPVIGEKAQFCCLSLFQLSSCREHGGCCAFNVVAVIRGSQLPHRINRL